MALEDLKNSDADELLLQYAGPRWYRIVELRHDQGATQAIPVQRTIETATSRDEASMLLRMAGWVNTKKNTGQGEIWMRPRAAQEGGAQ